MKIPTIFLTFIVLTGCQPSAMISDQNSSQLRLPRNMSSNKPDKGRYLGDSVYTSAAIKYTISNYKDVENVKTSDVSLFYPDVLPDQLDNYPMLAAHIELNKVEKKDHDLLDLVVVYMSKDGSLLHIKRTHFKEHNTKKHGAPW